MTAHASVKLWDGFTVDSFFAYNGRFTFTCPAIDPGDWTSGDGFVNEIDFVVEDPDDPAYVWDIGMWTSTAGSIADATVTAGFSFDSSAPTLWDSWAVSRVLRTTWDGPWGYTFPYGGIFDGGWSGPFATLVVTDIDGTSDADWNHQAVHAAATITAPTAGSTIDSGVVGSVSVTVTSTAAFTDLEYQFLTGGPASALSFASTSSHSFSVAIPFPTNTTTLEARVKDAGTSWSSWASIGFTITGTVDTPVACFEAEALLDTPEVLWLFREATGATTVADLSGNAHGGLYINKDLTGAPTSGESPEAGHDPDGICDSGCTDVNHAVDLFYDPADPSFTGLVRTSNTVGAGNYPLSGATTFTLEMIVALMEVGTDVGKGAYLGAQSLNPTTENQAIPWPVWLLPGGTPDINTEVNAITGTGRKAGCFNHIVWTYTATADAAGNRHRIYANGALISTDTFALTAGQLTAATEGPLQVVGEVSFSYSAGYMLVGAAACYRSVLPYHRIVAHAAHLCACGTATGMGFVLGHLTFN